MLDPFDPNTWTALLTEQDNYEYRVYLDDRGTTYALVSREDYQWAVQWRWNAKRDPSGAIYARRTQNIWAEGVKWGTRTIYLHIEVMKRSGIRPRTKTHKLVDHRNGKTLDCRRSNLRYATGAMNRNNRWGGSPSSLDDIFGDGGLDASMVGN